MYSFGEDASSYRFNSGCDFRRLVNDVVACKTPRCRQGDVIDGDVSSYSNEMSTLPCELITDSNMTGCAVCYPPVAQRQIVIIVSSITAAVWNPYVKLSSGNKPNAFSRPCSPPRGWSASYAPSVLSNAKWPQSFGEEYGRT